MWERVGQVIQGLYLDQYPYQGIVESSRVKFGGEVQHTVALMDQITVMGAEKDTLLINESEKFSLIYVVDK